MAYNGHKNWSHWNVSLWISNDEGLYRHALDCLSTGRTKADAAKLFLDHLNEMGTTKTPDGARYTVTTIRAAMRGLT